MSRALFLIQVYLRSKFCPFLLITVGLREFTSCIIHFSMFSMSFSGKKWPSARHASDADIVHWQKRKFFMLVSCLAYYSILKMETIYSSERSVDFHPTTRLYVPGDRTLRSHGCESLRPNNLAAIFTNGRCFPPHSPHANIISSYCKPNMIMFLYFILLLCHQ